MSRHVFETVTKTGTSVSVTIEPGKRGLGDALTVRDADGTLMLASPVQHVDAELLGAYFDAADTAAILERLSQ